MKFLSLLICCFFVTFNIYPQVKHPDNAWPNPMWNPDSVKGGYRVCKEYSYKYKGGEIDYSSKNLEKTYKFDKKGHQIEEIYNHPPDSHPKNLGKNIRKFNDNGKLIESIQYYFDGTIFNKTSITYDEKNREIENKNTSKFTHIDEDDPIGQTLKKTTYNNKFNKIQSVYEEYINGGEKESFSRINYVYDDNGQLIEEHKIHSNFGEDLTNFENGKKIKAKHCFSNDNCETSIYFYDLKGNLTEEVFKDNHGKTKTQKYFYNDNNQLIKHIQTEESGLTTEKEKYVFDLNGNKIEEVLMDFNGQNKKVKYIYNDNNQLIEEIQYDSTGSINYRTFYTYDDNSRFLELKGSGENNSFNSEIHSYHKNSMLMKCERMQDFKNIHGFTEYDDKGRVLEYKNEFDNSLRYYKYVYSGNKIIEYFCRDNIRLEAFKYNNLGNLTERIIYDEFDEPKLKYEYIYSK